MLEKSGTIRLSRDDIEKAKRETVSERVKSTWGLTLPQLQEVIESHSYVLIDDDKGTK